MLERVTYEMIGETMAAHDEFNPPAVYMTVLIEDSEGSNLCIRDRFAPNELPLFACSCVLSCDQTADILLAMYRLPQAIAKRKSISLVSDQDLFDKAYIYLFVVSINKADIKDWLNSTSLEVIPVLDCDPSSPVTRRLLSHLALNPVLDNFSLGPPSNFGASNDRQREEGTRLLKCRCVCMPLITVNALILQVDHKGRPVGGILAKRASSCSREGGKWYVPSGFVAGHESAAQALARETHEEANLTLHTGDIRKLLFILDPSPEERVWINWPLFYAVTTHQRPEEFWRGSNEEVEQVSLFDLGAFPRPTEIAFGHGDLIPRGFELFVSSIEWCHNRTKVEKW